MSARPQYDKAQADALCQTYFLHILMILAREESTVIRSQHFFVWNICLLDILTGRHSKSQSSTWLDLLGLQTDPAIACSFHMKGLSSHGAMIAQAKCASFSAMAGACRINNLGRSFEEVSKVSDQCTKKAMTKAFKTMQTNVLTAQERVLTVGAHPADYMVRLCNQLGLGAQHQKACQDFYENAVPRGGKERSGR